MAGTELRPRLASEIVDAAFQLYRRHFTDLVTLTAIAFAPLVLAQLVITGGTPPETTDNMGAVAALGLGGWVFGSLAEAAIVVAVSSSYLTGHANVPAAIRRTLGRLGTVLLAVAAKWFLIGLAFLLSIFVAAIVGAMAAAGAGGPGLIVGAILMLVAGLLGLPLGIYLFARYFAVPATIVLEGSGVLAGLRRSATLSKGHKRKIIGALGIPILLFAAFQFTVTFLAMLLPGPDFVGFLAAEAVHILAYPILSVIATLLYYDARIRSEGFDIEIMAADLGLAAAGAPVHPAGPA